MSRELTTDSYCGELLELVLSSGEDTDGSFDAGAAELMQQYGQLLEEESAGIAAEPEKMTETINGVFPDYAFNGENAEQLAQQNRSAFETLYGTEAEIIGSEDARAAGVADADGFPEAIEYAKTTLGQRLRVRDVIRLLRTDKGKIAGEGNHLLKDVVEHAMENADAVLERAQSLSTPQSLIESWKDMRVSMGIYGNIGTLMTAAGCYTAAQTEDYRRRVVKLNGALGVLSARMQVMANPVSRVADAEQIANADDDEREKLKKRLKAAERSREQAGIMLCNMMTELRVARIRYFLSQLSWHFKTDVSAPYRFRDVSGAELSIAAAYRLLVVRRAPIYAVPADLSRAPQLVQPLNSSGRVAVGQEIEQLADGWEIIPDQPGGFLRGLDKILKDAGLGALRAKSCIEYENYVNEYGVEPAFIGAIKQTLENLRELFDCLPDFSKEPEKAAKEDDDAPAAEPEKNASDEDVREKLEAMHKALLEARADAAAKAGTSGSDAVVCAAKAVIAFLFEKQIDRELGRLSDEKEGAVSKGMRELLNKGEPADIVSGQAAKLAENGIFAGAVKSMTGTELKTLCAQDMSRETVDMLRELSATLSRAVSDNARAAGTDGASGSGHAKHPEAEKAEAEAKPEELPDGFVLLLEKPGQD